MEGKPRGRPRSRLMNRLPSGGGRSSINPILLQILQKSDTVLWRGFSLHRSPLMRTSGLCLFPVVLLLCSPSMAGAQPNCKKGIPCGNSCISSNKVCRITGTSPAKASGEGLPAVSPVAIDTSPRKVHADSAWVGSVADGVYFRPWCPPAQDLAPSNRRYFRSEEAAKSAGFRKSRTPGC